MKLNKKQITLIFIGIFIGILVLINFPFPPNIQIINLDDSYSIGDKLYFSVIIDGCEDCSSWVVKSYILETGEVIANWGYASDGAMSPRLFYHTEFEINPSDRFPQNFTDISNDYTVIVEFAHEKIFEKKITITDF